MVNKIDTDLLLLLHDAVSKAGEARVSSALQDLANFRDADDNDSVANSTDVITFPHMADDVLTVTEAAKVLELSTESVRVYCQRGDLKAQRVSSGWIIERSVVEAFKAQGRRPRGRPKKILEVG